VVPVDLTTPAERLTKPEVGMSHVPETWSPDGRTVLFASTSTGNSVSQLWALSIADRKTARFADVESAVIPAATFSPDGRWVSYTSREVGHEGPSVFIRPFPATGTKYLVTANGFRSLWSRDGNELFFARRGQSFVVRIPADRTSAVGNPVELPIRRFPPPGTASEREYDVLPDGRRFVFAYPADARQAAGGQVNVVLNWSEALKQKVPTR
jgi:dipeptidyl aminopeptidase/acylaminoacyl peptidase